MLFSYRARGSRPSFPSGSISLNFSRRQLPELRLASVCVCFGTFPLLFSLFPRKVIQRGRNRGKERDTDGEEEREGWHLEREGQIEAQQSCLKIDGALAKLSISELIKENDAQLR